MRLNLKNRRKPRCLLRLSLSLNNLETESQYQEAGAVETESQYQLVISPFLRLNLNINWLFRRVENESQYYLDLFRCSTWNIGYLSLLRMSLNIGYLAAEQTKKSQLKKTII